MTQLFLLVTFVFAAEQKPADVEQLLRTPRLWAVVVGVSEYQGVYPPHPSCRFDAVRFSKRLSVESPEQVFLLTDHPEEDGSVNATAANIRSILQSIANEASRTDVVLVAVFTRGVLGDQCRWFLSGSHPDQKQSMISSQEWARLLKRAPCQAKMLLADVAFEPDRNFPDELDPARLFGPLSDARVYVLSSSDGSAFSSASEGAGVFCSRAVDALNGAADNFGGEADGWVTGHELSSHILRSARDDAMKPAYWGARGFPFVRLARNVSVLKEVRQRLQQLVYQAEQNILGRELFETGTALLAEMPRGEAKQQLRRAYEEYLRDGNDDVERLDAALNRVRAAARATLGEKQRFVQWANQARLKIDAHYVLPNKGMYALTSGVRGLYYHEFVPIPATIDRQLRSAQQRTLPLFLGQVFADLGEVDARRAGELIDTLLAESLRSLDEHSAYLPPADWQDVKAASVNGYVGIGVQLREDTTTGAVFVASTMYQSPAYKKGLQAGDRLLTIDGNDVSCCGLDEAANLLVGAKSTPVQITVARKSTPQLQQFELIREELEFESVIGLSRNPDFTWNHWLSKSDGIGYAYIVTFTSETRRQLDEVVERLIAVGMKALVLDLRFNSGGVLQSAIDVADRFLSHGRIVTIRRRGANQRTVSSRLASYKGDFPVVVLLNRDSASGSEIVAAAMQDNRRAVIGGERSYGKGSIQGTFPLGNEPSGLKLTVATFTRPNGQSLHRSRRSLPTDQWGVVPNPRLRNRLTPAKFQQLHQWMQSLPFVKFPRRPSQSRRFDDAQLELAVTYLKDVLAN